MMCKFERRGKLHPGEEFWDIHALWASELGIVDIMTCRKLQMAVFAQTPLLCKFENEEKGPRAVLECTYLPELRFDLKHLFLISFFLMSTWEIFLQLLETTDRSPLSREDNQALRLAYYGTEST